MCEPLSQRLVMCVTFFCIVHVADMASMEDEDELLTECIEKVRAVR